MEGVLEDLDTVNSRQFFIAVRRLATSLSYGTDRSPFLGSGIEYAQSRQYQYGDPIRSIDWRVSARTGKIYVKEYQAPKRLPCYLLLDTSASMMVRSHRKSKYALAVQIAGGVAFASLDRVSPVGLVGVGSRNIRVEPSLSKQQIMIWLQRLRRFRYDESTALGKRIAELSPSLTDRALVIVFSDLHDPRALSALKRMAQFHDVAVLELIDPAESGLPGSGFLRAQEAETGHAFVTHGRRQWLDQNVVEEQLKQGRIDHLVIETHQPFIHKVRHFFQSRDLLGRSAR